jgi:hypothetical protein
MKVVTLDYIVRSVIAQLEESTLRRYNTYFQYAVRGFRDLNLFAHAVSKFAYLNMSQNKTVDLPLDYVKYVKIGICVNGHIINLGLDETMCMKDSYDDCGNPIKEAIDRVASNDLEYFMWRYPYNNYFNNGQYVAGVFGLGGGFNRFGYYKVDEENRQIRFSSEVPSVPIVLEYISDGVTPDGSATVPIEAAEALIAFIHWKRLEYKKGVSLGEVDYAKRRYLNEFNNYKFLKQSFTVQEYLDMSRRGIFQTPKR